MKLMKLNNLQIGTPGHETFWEGDVGARTGVLLCHDTMKKLFGLKKRNRYSLTLYSTKPKKKKTQKYYLMIEPHLQGNTLYIQRGKINQRVEEPMASLILDNTWFWGKLTRKIWVRVQQLPCECQD